MTDRDDTTADTIEDTAARLDAVKRLTDEADRLDTIGGLWHEPTRQRAAEYRRAARFLEQTRQQIKDTGDE